MVSVIIPTYNAEQYIKECLGSIIHQTYCEKEIIIIDGLSTDTTVSIVEEFSLKFQYITYVSEKDAGIYDAMNKGIKKAKGEWVIFLGSDDKLYTNNILEEIFSKQENIVADVLYGNVCSSMFREKYDGLFTARKLLDKNICHQAIFFKRKVFRIVGNFSLKYKILADWEHNIRWFFDPKITHQYIDFIICNYSEVGISSTLVDNVFLNNKLKIYLRHAFFYIDKSFRRELLNKLIYSYHESSLSKFFYKILFHLSKI